MGSYLSHFMVKLELLNLLIICSINFEIMILITHKHYVNEIFFSYAVWSRQHHTIYGHLLPRQLKKKILIAKMSYQNKSV